VRALVRIDPAVMAGLASICDAGTVPEGAKPCSDTRCARSTPRSVERLIVAPPLVVPSSVAARRLAVAVASAVRVLSLVATRVCPLRSPLLGTTIGMPRTASIIDAESTDFIMAFPFLFCLEVIPI
jgi:hypothetical protein